MARKPGAGDLKHRVAFDVREVSNPDAPEDYGNTVDEWVEQFTCRAGYRHLRGGETIMAGRLQGRHAQIVFVRASSETRQVTQEWRMRDLNNGEWDDTSETIWTGPVYAVKDVSPGEDRQWIDFLVESGVAV
jgi:head-tail adaptor